MTRSKRTRVPFAVVGERLRAIAAVDLDNVGLPDPPSIEIATLAWVPDHPIVAALTKDLIIPVAAGQRIIALATE